jgi:predicted protein tyrosine phosphatase
MFIERLQRDLAICSATQITPFLAKEPGRWHVVSIREPIQTEADLTQACSSHPMVFDDVLSQQDELGRGPTAAHLAAFWAYVAGTGREPLVLQCWAGRSRSTAVALVVIVKELSEAGLEGAELVQAAVDILLTLRPQALPNALVLRLGLEQFLPAPQGETLSKALMREPRIRKNFG